MDILSLIAFFILVTWCWSAWFALIVKHSRPPHLGRWALFFLFGPFTFLRDDGHETGLDAKKP